MKAETEARAPHVHACGGEQKAQTLFCRGQPVDLDLHRRTHAMRNMDVVLSRQLEHGVANDRVEHVTARLADVVVDVYRSARDGAPLR